MFPARDTVRVLHVDDDRAFAETTAAFLEETDDRFEVETATSADEGLERLEDDVDCVVSDYDMPGRNGIEFLETVRADRPALPFILFTGKGSEEVASDAISAGVTDYLHKKGGTSQYALLANRIANAVEQYRSRVALEESQKRLSLFVEQSPLGVIEYDETFEIVGLNPAGEEILGYTEAELRGETWEALVTDESYENVDAVTDALSEGAGGFHSVDENVRKDGERIVCEWHNRVVTDDSGAVVAVFSLFQDVTERTRRERELEAMNRRLEAILDNTTTPMYMKDDEGRFRFVNRGFRELFGLEDEEIVGRTDHDLFPAALADEYRANDLTVLDRGEPVEAEERVTVDGDRRVFVSTKVPIYDTGERADPDEPVAVFGVSLDITERKARERELRRYEKLVNTMQEAAAIYDEAGRFVFVNDYLAEFYGTTPEALVGEDSQLVPRIRDEHGRDAYRELLAGERDELRGELAAEFSGVGYEVLAYRLAPLVIDGAVEGVVAVAHEVTEYKRRERELERRNEQLDRFASLVSHDLRSPLNVAEGRIDLAMAECDSEHLPPAANALDRCAALVDDLLALAREGDTVHDTDVVDLASTVEACWDAVAMGDATLVVDTERSVRADRSRLRQLLENLLRNAVEHGSTGPRSQAREDSVERGSTASRPGAGDSVEHGSTSDRPGGTGSVEHGRLTVTVGDLPGGFYVADDGPGIPPEARDRVFEAGYSTVTEGTGFGLAIVREVADAHGWQVAAAESDDGGARFEITGVDADPE
jgi:PAS domain S-box-containing protein